MATKKIFRCVGDDDDPGCGHTQPTFFGKCPQCGKFGTAQEMDEGEQHARVAHRIGSVSPAKFIDVRSAEASKEKGRFSTGIEELDRVLGGGLVPASYLILAGEPGAGKTTMASEILLALAAEGKKVGYISGEESPAQAHMRFKRLAGEKGIPDGIQISTETSVEKIIEAVAAEGHDLIVIDSIQTTYSEDIPGAPGSLSQVRESGQKLLRAAKDHGASVLLIGQVTKEGSMAGPRNLEHMVDVVLQFEGDRREEYRILRAVKNRFGTIDEIGVFEMTSQGLIGISDPSQLFVDEQLSPMPGSVYSAVLEGTRPLLCEIQALTVSTQAPQPTRSVRGLDRNRVQMLLAVLQRKCHIPLHSMDIYVNVAGGMKVDEPGVDLAVCLAVASAALSRPPKQSYCAYGEVSLLGLVRPASQGERRRKEAERLGLKVFDCSNESQIKKLLDSALGEAIDDTPYLEDD